MAKSDSAIVHESVEIETLDGGKKREVDVVAVGAVAGHRTVVAIEARDTKRKQDVLWVEQAKTKFERLGANVKILVSSSGFTAEALESATKFGIKTITPGEVTEEFNREGEQQYGTGKFQYLATGDYPNPEIQRPEDLCQRAQPKTTGEVVAGKATRR